MPEDTSGNREAITIVTSDYITTQDMEELNSFIDIIHRQALLDNPEIREVELYSEINKQVINKLRSDNRYMGRIDYEKIEQACHDLYKINPSLKNVVFEKNEDMELDPVIPKIWYHNGDIDLEEIIIDMPANKYRRAHVGLLMNSWIVEEDFPSDDSNIREITDRLDKYNITEEQNAEYCRPIEFITNLVTVEGYDPNKWGGGE